MDSLNAIMCLGPESSKYDRNQNQRAFIWQKAKHHLEIAEDNNGMNSLR